MEIKNTSTVKLSIDTAVNVSLENGTIPSGVSGPGAKYPIDAAGVSIFDPNDLYGPTYSPYVNIEQVFDTYKVQINGDWTGKVRAGDVVQVSRGTLDGEYTVQTVYANSLTSKTLLSFSTTRDVVSLLTPFIGLTGYPSASSDVFLKLSRRVENPNTSSTLLRNFYVTLQDDKTRSDGFNATVYWDVDPSVAVTRIRWRSVPRSTVTSTLYFNVLTQGYYSQIPRATLISNTGRSGQVRLSGSVNTVSVATGGSGYSTAYAIASGGGGTGASFSVSLSGNSVSSIAVTTGGTGYTSVPTVTIYGNGSGASASVSVMRVNGASVAQQGGNYLTGPTVSVDSTYLVGAPVVIGSTVSIANMGRIDYVRVVDGGTGYTGASIGIAGGSVNATATAEITDGVITNIILNTSGYGYTASSVTITPSGLSGSGASAVANIDLYSQWVYESPETSSKSKTISGLKYNIPYEIEILVSQDELFRGVMKYSEPLFFQYYKA
jgi:hypothetical protein